MRLLVRLIVTCGTGGLASTSKPWWSAALAREDASVGPGDGEIRGRVLG